MNLSVIGYGVFGTSLSYLLSGNCDNIFIWQWDDVFDLDTIQRNKKISICHNIDNAIKNSDIVIISTASVGCEFVFKEIQKSENRFGKKYIITSKGIDKKTLNTMCQLFSSINPDLDVVVFSGPTFAKEITRELPVWALIASENDDLNQEIVKKLHVHKKLNLLTSNDPVGIGVFASLKNVAAIIAGLVDSFGLGDSAKGAVLSLVISDIIKIAKAYGAKDDTFFSVAGIGDFITSCCGKYGRNYRTGVMIGQGKSIDDIVISIGEISEGIKTTEVAYLLLNKFHISSKIISGLYGVIYNGYPVSDYINSIVEN